VLSKTLGVANAEFLDSNKSPSRKVGELDNRGSHFYLALYWAKALAAQTDDLKLKALFEPVAKALTENEAKIVAELSEVQGKPVDIGGYYRPDAALTIKAMCPSATFNAILASIA
jgi:isocitrate dehydrogenase